MNQAAQSDSTQLSQASNSSRAHSILNIFKKAPKEESKKPQKEPSNPKKLKA